MINLSEKFINEELIDFFYKNKSKILEILNSVIPENVIIKNENYRIRYAVNEDNKFLYIKTEKDLNIGLKIFEVKLLKNSFYKIYGVKYKQYIENGFDI